MMRIRPISTRLTLLMAAIVLAAPVVTNLLMAYGEPPGRYCSAGICADGRNLESSKLTRGPDFVVHHFDLFDGSSAAVYVGNFPERPPRNAVRTLMTIDGLGCDRVTAPEWRDREVAVYCEWSERSPTNIHAWAVAHSHVEHSEALKLIQSLEHCSDPECPWPAD